MCRCQRSLALARSRRARLLTVVDAVVGDHLGKHNEVQKEDNQEALKHVQGEDQALHCKAPNNNRFKAENQRNPSLRNPREIEVNTKQQGSNAVTKSTRRQEGLMWYRARSKKRSNMSNGGVGLLGTDRAQQGSCCTQKTSRARRPRHKMVSAAQVNRQPARGMSW